MSYADLVDRFEDEDAFPGAPRRVVALPDGSIDCCYRVAGPEGERLESGEALGRLLADDVETFPLERTENRTGGQAVNAATQVHELGDHAALVGHLDHPLLADFPFETHSMGEPSTIRVFAFDGEERLFPERGDATAWGIDDLLAVVDWDVVTSADALCCTNWVSFRGLTDVLDRLAASAVDAPVVLDPGSIGLVERAALAEFFETISAADSPLEVVLSVNRPEYETAADVAGVREATPAALLAELRSTLEITGVVFHGADEAVAATREGTTGVETPGVDDPALTMGAGDRFSGGLASALARDWTWEEALALGNACASRFVATGETGSRSELGSFLRDRC